MAAVALTFAAALTASPVLADEVQGADQAGGSADMVRFDVHAIQVVGNQLLPPEQVEALVYPYMGPGRSADDIEAARAALQKAYEAKGYATVGVFIPEQSVESGIIRLEVQPQTVGRVIVEGGKRTPESWVRKRMPSLTPGAAPNFNEFQRDIVALNQAPDRRVTPEVRAGEAPGTMDVVLKVEDGSPFHGSLELNNFHSAGTSTLRTMASLRHDDLWGRGDSVSISAQTAPERTGDGTVLSGNYLARIGSVQLLGYGVYSDSNIAVVGGTSVIGQGVLFGLRGIIPLGQSEGFYHSVTVGADWKDFKENVVLGSDRDRAPIKYLPVNLAWRGDWTGETLRAYTSLTTVFGLRGIGDGRERFDYKRYGAKPNFFVLKGEAGWSQDIAAGFQPSLRLTGQWSPEPLISNEGFSLGGMESVRGYYESEALGDYGAAAQAELRSPDLAGFIGGPLGELRFHVFADVGAAAIHEALPEQDSHWEFASTGIGGRIKLFDHFNGAVDVGVPLLSGSNSESGSIFARFRIWGEF